MKKLMFLVFLSVGYLEAAPLFTDAPINAVGTPTTIAISSTTQTKVPSTQTLSSRVGIYLSNPSTSSVAGFIGDCSTTTFATSIRPIEFSNTQGGTVTNFPFYVPLRVDTCLWLISTDVTFASKNIHYQEVSK